MERKEVTRAACWESARLRVPHGLCSGAESEEAAAEGEGSRA